MTVVLVPHRSDGGGHRDRSWNWIRARWERELPDWPIHVGNHDDGPFSRARAINLAAAAAGDWEIAVLADSDTFCGAAQLIHALDVAQQTQLMTFAFTRVRMVTEQGAEAVMGGDVGNWERYVEKDLIGGCSSLVMTPRAVWDAVGGMDEGFETWGEEDIAFSLAAQTLAPARNLRREGFYRVPGDCWHLWHPISPFADPEGPSHRRNLARRQRYVEAAHQPDVMEALLDELHVGGRR